MEYAPVVLPTLCRYEHFVECIKSLEANSLAAYTELYISIDYPKEPGHIKGREKIKDFLKSNKLLFKKTIIIEQKSNLGAIENGSFLIDYVFRSNDRLIFSEDDNVFAPSALEYFNKGLYEFESESQITALCANNLVLKDLRKGYKSNYVKSQNFSAHGCAIWRTKYTVFKNRMCRQYINKIGRTFHDVMAVFISNYVLFFYFMDLLMKSSPFYEDHDGKARLTDIGMSIYLVHEGKYVLYPTDNLAVNKGYDGSGANCGVSEYRREFLSSSVDFDFLLVDEIQMVKLYNQIRIGDLLRIIKEWILWWKFYNSSNSKISDNRKMDK